MIVDGHAHAFPYLGEAGGFGSAEEHRRLLQRHMSTHPQGARRLRDNALVTEPMLWDGRNPDLNALPDVNFRVGRFGRFEWEWNGEGYYVQFLPPHLEDTEARPERMLAQMQYLGVDRALLQSGRLYGITNEYLAGVVRQWPDKFRGCAIVNENQADSPAQIDTLRHAVTALGLSALYFANDGYAESFYERHFDDERYFPFWEDVQSLQIPVIWDIRFALRRTHADYMREVVRMHGHLRRFPRIRNVLSHGMPANAFDAGGAMPDDLWAMLMEPNMTVELLFPLLHGATWDYPYPEAQAIVRQLYQRLGATKLVWGADMPNVERSCTYRQSLDYVRKYCTFIEESDMDLVIGRNALELYFSSAPAGR